MNKKVMWIIIVVLVALVSLFMYNQYMAPQATEGEKSVTIEVVAESEGISKIYDLNTDAAFLYDLLMEIESDIQPEFEEASFGIYLTGLEGYTADETKNEFYSIKVNGVDALYGVKELPVIDGEVYRFELSTW
jgi:hypothetical protein